MTTDARNRFRRSDRITASTEFSRILRTTARKSSKYFFVYCKRGKATKARLGISIGRRVDKRASERNRIKRIVRESFRARAPSLEPVDIIVLPKPACAGTSSARLMRELQLVLSDFVAPEITQLDTKGSPD